MNENKNIPMSFRTSLNGYKKEDVNRYIQQMNFQFTRAEEMKNAELNRLCAELDACRQAGGEAPALKEEIEKLKVSLENAERAASAAREEAEKKAKEAEELNKMNTDNSELFNSIMTENAAQLEALKAENAALKEENEKLKNRTETGEREQKALRYEKMSSQLGDIILSANADADRIREEAMQDAEQIHAEAEKEAAELVEKTNERLQSEIEEAGERLRNAYRAATADCERIVAGLKDSLASADSAMEARTDAFLAGLKSSVKN